MKTALRQRCRGGGVQKAPPPIHKRNQLRDSLCFALRPSLNFAPTTTTRRQSLPTIATPFAIRARSSQHSNAVNELGIPGPVVCNVDFDLSGAIMKFGDGENGLGVNESSTTIVLAQQRYNIIRIPYTVPMLASLARRGLLIRYLRF